MGSSVSAPLSNVERTRPPPPAAMPLQSHPNTPQQLGGASTTLLIVAANGHGEKQLTHYDDDDDVSAEASGGCDDKHPHPKGFEMHRALEVSAPSSIVRTAVPGPPRLLPTSRPPPLAKFSDCVVSSPSKLRVQDQRTELQSNCISAPLQPRSPMQTSSHRSGKSPRVPPPTITPLSSYKNTFHFCSSPSARLSTPTHFSTPPQHPGSPPSPTNGSAWGASTDATSIVTVDPSPILITPRKTTTTTIATTGAVHCGCVGVAYHRCNNHAGGQPNLTTRDTHTQSDAHHTTQSSPPHHISGGCGNVSASSSSRTDFGSCCTAVVVDVVEELGAHCCSTDVSPTCTMQQRVSFFDHVLRTPSITSPSAVEFQAPGWHESQPSVMDRCVGRVDVRRPVRSAATGGHHPQSDDSRRESFAQDSGDDNELSMSWAPLTSPMAKHRHQLARPHRGRNRPASR